MNGKKEVQVEQSNPIENLAKEYGWVPEGKKSAEEYVKYALEKLPERGEALTAQNKKIEAKDNELFKMQTMLSEITVHMNKQKELAYQQALKDINEQRRLAIKNGDVDKVDELEQQKLELEKPTNNTHDAVVQFEERNKSWLQGDSLEELEMQDWVERHGQLLGKKKLPVDEHMRRLEEDLHKKFSTYFDKGDNTFRSVESADKSNVAGHVSKKTHTYNDLTPVQKAVAKHLKDTGVMEIKEYIAQLEELGDLK